MIANLHGDIHTTAPETLPKTEPEPFQTGDPVTHKRFGSGVVLDSHCSQVLVKFGKLGSKRLKAEFLRKA